MTTTVIMDDDGCMLNVWAINSVAGSVLAGRLAGDALRLKLEGWLRSSPNGATVVLDFSNVELVTASYFLAAFAWLWKSAEIAGRDLYPVLANLADEVQEEVTIAIEATGIKLLCGRIEGNSLSILHALNLDSIEKETYSRVEELGEATAGDLFRIEPRTQPTAWSNRLAQLFTFRVLRRRKAGRQVFYSLVWR